MFTSKTLYFKCAKKGVCCNEYIRLYSREIYKYSDRFFLNPTPIYEPVDVVGSKIKFNFVATCISVWQDDLYCRYLDKAGLCTIYSDRPIKCQQFPIDDGHAKICKQCDLETIVEYPRQGYQEISFKTVTSYIKKVRRFVKEEVSLYKKIRNKLKALGLDKDLHFIEKAILSSYSEYSMPFIFYPAIYTMYYYYRFNKNLDRMKEFLKLQLQQLDIELARCSDNRKITKTFEFIKHFQIPSIMKYRGDIDNLVLHQLKIYKEFLDREFSKNAYF